ncbi:MAG TPA: hypothetical protein VME69_06500 [Methylocella sp.]|nr:hypothetical protein [Methylocella sp.]
MARDSGIYSRVTQASGALLLSTVQAGAANNMISIDSIAGRSLQLHLPSHFRERRTVCWAQPSEFVATLHGANVKPHITQNNGTTKTGPQRNSVIDGRTPRHAGYGIWQTRRAIIKCIFGWGKQHGRMRKTTHSKMARLVANVLLNLIAYNLIRIRLMHA